MLKTLVTETQFSTIIIMLINLFSLKLLQAISKGRSWEVGRTAKLTSQYCSLPGTGINDFSGKQIYKEISCTLSLPRFYYFNLWVLTIKSRDVAVPLCGEDHYSLRLVLLPLPNIISLYQIQLFWNIILGPLDVGLAFASRKYQIKSKYHTKLISRPHYPHRPIKLLSRIIPILNIISCPKDGYSLLEIWQSAQ